MRKDVNLSFEDDVIWSYIKDREILPFEKDLRVKASIAKGGIKGGSFFSAMLPFSWFISEDQLYTTKRKFHFFNISRDPWIIEKDLSTLKKKDSIFLFFMIAASQKIPTLPTYCWCDLSARKLKMFFFLKKKCNICNNTRKRHRCRTLRMKERAKIFWNLVSSSVMGIKNIKVKQK